MYRHPAVTRVLSVCISLLMMFQPIAHAVEAPAVPLRSETEMLGRLAEDFENACELLAEALPRIPRDTFDPAVIVEEGQSEPTRLFRWVRDNTWLVPYRGLLRSWEGVLMDRLGNSLDRAMLLCRLLEMAGQEVRLARGSLSDEELRTLVSGSRPVPPSGSHRITRNEGGLEESFAFAERYAAEKGLDAAMLRGSLEEHSKAARYLAGEARRRTSSQSDALMTMLGDIARRASAGADRTEEAYRDHWWVQWKNGERWTDLDPSLPDARPGRPLTVMRENILPEQIAESLKHSVEVRVIAEVSDKGALRERTLLRHALRPSEVMGRRVVLAYHPLRWPSDAKMIGGNLTFERFQEVLQAQNEWLPVLLVGKEIIHQSRVTVDGVVNDNPRLDAVTSAGEGLGSALGGFASVLDSIGRQREPAESSVPAPGGTFSALWIEYAIAVPGQPEEVIRREIFDLHGPAARLSGRISHEMKFGDDHRLSRAGALLTVTELAFLSCRPSEDFILHSFAQSVLAQREFIPEILRKAGEGKTDTLLSGLVEALSLPGAPYWLASARSTWRRDGASVYTDRPVVLAHHRGINLPGQSEKVAFEAFDIVHNRVAVTPGARDAAFRERLEQGVLDTNAESLLMQLDVSFGEVGGLGKNTAQAFEDSLRRGIPWVLVESPDDPAIQELAVSEDIRARLGADLAAGFLVAAPKIRAPSARNDDFCWWRIDPVTGDTLGIGSRGWGSEFVEYAVTIGLPLAFVGGFAGCMGDPAGWSETSAIKFLGCSICGWIAMASLAVVIFPPGPFAVNLGLGLALGGAGCGALSSLGK